MLNDMGLEQKLSQLDEVIWTQYEKVTQKADAYLGLDKYDLARGSVNVALAGSLAFTIYSAIRAVQYESSAAVGASLGVAMMLIDLSHKKDVARVQQFDSQLLKQGMRIIRPIYTQRRPLALLVSSIVIGAASRAVPEISENQDVQYLYNLGLGAQYLSILGSLSSSYFCSQLPKPPRQNRGKFQEWYKGLKEALGRSGAVGVNDMKCVNTNNLIGGI